MHLLYHWLASAMLTPCSPPAPCEGSASPWPSASSLQQAVATTWICKARWDEKEQGTLASSKQWLTHCWSARCWLTSQGFMLLWKTTVTDPRYNCWICIQSHVLRTSLNNSVKMVLSNTLFHHWNSAHFTGTYFNSHFQFGLALLQMEDTGCCNDDSRWVLWVYVQNEN